MSTPSTPTTAAPLDTWLASLAEGLVSASAPLDRLDFEVKFGVSAVRDAGLTRRYGQRGGPGEGLHLLFSPGVESVGATAILRGTLRPAARPDLVLAVEISGPDPSGWRRIAVQATDRSGAPRPDLPVELNLDVAQCENLTAATWSSAGPSAGSRVSPALTRTGPEGRAFARLVTVKSTASKAARAVVMVDAGGLTTWAAVNIP